MTLGWIDVEWIHLAPEGLEWRAVINLCLPLGIYRRDEQEGYLQKAA
jgi:hypothetical protein